ncbi:MAG: hypothetical protein WA414_12905 [Acidobacteriaceae bacterium]
MLSRREKGWLLIGIVVAAPGAVMLIQNPLRLGVGFQIACGVTGVAGVLAYVWAERRFKDSWPARPRNQKLQIIAAAVALLIVVTVIHNRKDPDAVLEDSLACGLMIGFVSLYFLFSKSMDALAARLSRRRGG